eukprot:9092331-Ditylum_brightwellii.AAC.1
MVETLQQKTSVDYQRLAMLYCLHMITVRHQPLPHIVHNEDSAITSPSMMQFLVTDEGEERVRQRCPYLHVGMDSCVCK